MNTRSFPIRTLVTTVVVDPFTADSPVKIEGPYMRIQQNLQGLPHIGDTERHATVTEAELCNLDLDVHPDKLYLLVTPIKLESFTDTLPTVHIEGFHPWSGG